MKMSLVVEGLRADVAAVGELGDETVAEVERRGSPEDALPSGS